MSNLKIFVSSTCYDLNIIRSQLRSFILNIGYEPVMSDYSDVLYDPRSHTHESCVKEIINCDIIVLIIGSRYGGKALPKAISQIDIETLRKLSRGQAALDNIDNISITQLEIFKAIENGLPIFTFIDESVNHDHLVYEKNKNKSDVISQIDFPSIEKKETAQYIFEFINFLRLRTENNSVTVFSRMEDIETYLKKQWAFYFQRLLSEQKDKKIEIKQMEVLANQIADLKTVIMSSISNVDLKNTAIGVIKFRRVIEFIYTISPTNYEEALLSDISWEELLYSKIGVSEMRPQEGHSVIQRLIIIKKDNTYYKTRFSDHSIRRLAIDWSGFKNMSDQSKKAIINAVVESIDVRFGPFVRVGTVDDNESLNLKNSLEETDEDS